MFTLTQIIFCGFLCLSSRFLTGFAANPCVSSCVGVPGGDYQSCNGCNVYVTCSNGIIYDNRPCPADLVWDDSLKNCDWSSSTCPGGCPTGWVTYGSSCYYFGNEDLWYNNARTVCINKGANLVQVDSYEELNWLKDYMLNRGIVPTHGYWNDGFQPTFDDTNYIWRESGAPLAITDWNDGQPFDHGNEIQRCVAFWWSFQRKQADIECYVPEYGDGRNGRKCFTLCERPLVT